MEINQILSELSEYDGVYKREVIDEAIAKKEQIKPYLYEILNTSLQNPPLNRLSDIESHHVENTYALYLLHVPMQLTILLIFKNFNISDLIYLNNFFFFIFFSLLIVLAYLCFNFFENPMSKKIRKNFLKKDL